MPARKYIPETPKAVPNSTIIFGCSACTKKVYKLPMVAAVRNLSRISDRFQSTAGTFEENIDKVLPQGQSIDLAFIDAIHTKEFVIPQLEIVMARSSDKAIIILDDINFSASMRECWETVSNDSRFLASAALDERVGILELNKSRKD